MQPDDLADKLLSVALEWGNSRWNAPFDWVLWATEEMRTPEERAIALLAHTAAGRAELERLGMPIPVGAEHWCV